MLAFETLTAQAVSDITAKGTEVTHHVDKMTKKGEELISSRQGDIEKRLAKFYTDMNEVQKMCEDTKQKLCVGSDFLTNKHHEISVDIAVKEFTFEQATDRCLTNIRNKEKECIDAIKAGDERYFSLAEGKKIQEQLDKIHIQTSRLETLYDDVTSRVGLIEEKPSNNNLISEEEPTSPTANRISHSDKYIHRKSKAWIHIDKVDGQYKCKYCDKSYDITSATSILLRHVRVCHATKFEEGNVKREIPP